MKDFENSYLLGAISKVLRADIKNPGDKVRFSCRPLVAHTSERNTALGRFTGKIGLPLCKEFKASLDDLVTENMAKVILDFSDVVLSKTAVGVLIGFAAAMHGHNKRLYLYRPSVQVRGVLKELNLTGFFSYLPTEDDLIATIVV